MAKRYIKISPFYNRPSTAGPLSAERLNAINDGLEAVDTYKIDVDAIVNNGVTTVEGTVLDGRMGKTLQDQVTTINNKFSYKNLSEQVSVLSEKFTLIAAYVENGIVAIHGSIASGAIADNINVFTIASDYRPRGMVNGMLSYSSVSDMASTQGTKHIRLDTTGVATFRQSSTNNASVNITLMYPLKQS